MLKWNGMLTVRKEWGQNTLNLPPLLSVTVGSKWGKKLSQRGWGTMTSTLAAVSDNIPISLVTISVTFLSLFFFFQKKHSGIFAPPSMCCTFHCLATISSAHPGHHVRTFTVISKAEKLLLCIAEADPWRMCSCSGGVWGANTQTCACVHSTSTMVFSWGSFP